MRPIKAQVDSVINSTAYVAKITFLNVESPSLVIVSKKADEELPTSNHLLIQHMINNRLSGPTVTSLEAGQQLLLYNYGDINDAEEYTWKL